MEPIALDIHTHLVPVDEAALAAIDGVIWDADSMALTVDGHKVGVKPLYSPKALIGWLDTNAIDAAWFCSAASAVPPKSI